MRRPKFSTSEDHRALQWPVTTFMPRTCRVFVASPCARVARQNRIPADVGAAAASALAAPVLSLPSTPTVTREHMSGLSPQWCHALDAPSIRGRHLCYHVSVSVSVTVSVWGQGQRQGWSWRQVCSNPCLTSSGTSQCVDSCKTQQDCDLDAHSSTPSTTTPCQLTSWCSRAIPRGPGTPWCWISRRLPTRTCRRYVTLGNLLRPAATSLR